MNNHVSGVGCVSESIFAVEHTIGYVQMVCDDLFLANPIQCGHIPAFSRELLIEEQAGKYHRTLRKRGTLIGIRGTWPDPHPQISLLGPRSAQTLGTYSVRDIVSWEIFGLPRIVANAML